MKVLRPIYRALVDIWDRIVSWLKAIGEPSNTAFAIGWIYWILGVVILFHPEKPSDEQWAFGIVLMLMAVAMFFLSFRERR